MSSYIGIEVSPQSIRAIRLVSQKNGVCVPNFSREVVLENSNNTDQITKVKEAEEIISVLQGLRKNVVKGGGLFNRPKVAISFPEEDYPGTDKGVMGEAAEMFRLIAKEAGFKKVKVLPESIALAKSVIPNGSDEPYLLIRLLDDRVNLTVVEGGKVRYTHSVSVSPHSAAEDYTHSPYAEDIRNAINEILIKQFTGHEPRLGTIIPKIKMAYISGPETTVPGIQKFLERHLKINVSVADVWTNCFDVKSQVPPIDHDRSLKFDVAVGLALSVR